MELISNPQVKEVFSAYPIAVQKAMLNLRTLVLAAANQTDHVESLEETLKWGEPSYMAKYGSTVRMDWKKKKPDQYALYFKCTSKLVSTFRILYKDKLKFEDNRAIIFKLDDKIPEYEIKHCVSLAFRYHKIKHMHLLGA